MTTFEQTWQQDNNRAPSNETTVALQAKSMLWYIKAFLKGEVGGATQGLWVCAGSSDSSSAGMDASDRWGSSFDSSKIVRNAAGAHSWIVLQSPSGLGGGPWYMLIDYNTGSDTSITVTFSKTVFTGGSTSTAPTSTTSWTYTNQPVTNSSLTSNSLFGLLSTAGDFHIKFSQAASGQFTFALSFFALTDTKTGEAHNGWSYVEYSASGVWLRANANSSSATPPVRGRNKDNTAAVVATLTTEYIASGGAAAMSDVGTQDATDGSYNDAPIRVQVTTTSHKSRRGRIRDVMWAPETAAVGLVEPTSGPPYESVVVGDTWHPYSASIVPNL